MTETKNQENNETPKKKQTRRRIRRTPSKKETKRIADSETKQSSGSKKTFDNKAVSVEASVDPVVEIKGASANGPATAQTRLKRKRGSRGRGRSRASAQGSAQAKAAGSKASDKAAVEDKAVEDAKPVALGKASQKSTVEANGQAESPANGGSVDNEATQKPRTKRRRGSRGRGRSRASVQRSAQTKSAEPATLNKTHLAKVDQKSLPKSNGAADKGKERQQAEAKQRECLIPDPIREDERVMLINVTEGRECRIAIIHQNKLEELFIERAADRSHVGNIYKGRVTNVEPSIQAAFVDFGLARNGFLHISDLQPQYFPGGRGRSEGVGRKTPRRDRPPIQKCLQRGQEVIVQIIKEGIGTKGPTLTTYISIPGRYLVMMPGMQRLGVSRKIEDEDVRRKMRQILDELNLPKDIGFILRTAGLNRSKRDLQRDLNYLQRLWKVVAQRIKSTRAPCELYQESDLVIRTIRDVYASDFSRLIVDSELTVQKVRDFLSIAMPRSASPVDVYTGRLPLFHKFGIETEIEGLHSRYVYLPSGGSLVIDSTEALVAIDVNSGRYRGHEDAEENAYRINMEAAEEIARQLRLRDLGGLILCDFIDMRFEKHNRDVERALRDALRKHKERAKCLRMSQFGIIEITRQRMRPSIKRSIYQDCPHCRGSGLVKNPESMTLDILRLLRLATHHEEVHKVMVRVNPTVAFQMQNQNRSALFSLEKETEVQITIRGDQQLGPDQYQFECLDRRGGPIRVIELPETQKRMVDQRARHRLPVLEPPPVGMPETLEDVLE